MSRNAQWSMLSVFVVGVTAYVVVTQGVPPWPFWAIVMGAALMVLGRYQAERKR